MASLIETQGNITFGVAITTSLVVLVVYFVGNAIYSLTLHPLADFPGPLLPAISRIPWWRNCIAGKQVTWIQALHQKYGPVVRFSPNDLSYESQGDGAWRDIYCHQAGRKDFLKPEEWFVRPVNGVRGINNALEPTAHRRLRGIFSPVFSDRALKSQEPLFRKHIDMLLSKLSEAVAEDLSVNMVDMFQFTTFDAMADLTFGEPLGLLQNSAYTEWLSRVFMSVKIIPIAQFIQCYPVLDYLFTRCEPKFITEMKYSHAKHSADRVDKRLEKGSDQPDIWNLVLSAEGDKRLNLQEMYTNADVFMLAGSETTATTMCGLMYHLLSNPEKRQILLDEIRTKFSSDDEIGFESTAGLKYLNACIHETLRLYPPVPCGIPRVVPAGGATIQSKFVGEETRVSVHHYTTYHSPNNFRDPEMFVPERWLGDPAYKDDRLEAVQAFSCGPRNCIGQNMAMYEMRLTMALVFYRFDFELCDESRSWLDQLSFVLWEKKSLICRLKKAKTV